MENVTNRLLSRSGLGFTVVLLAVTLLTLGAFPIDLRTENVSAASTDVQAWEILNLDGDLSLTWHEDTKFWNPHKVGFSNAVWNVSFGDRAKITLETVDGDFGHVAAGMWWTSAFKTGEKIPLVASEPSALHVDFDVRLESVSYDPLNGWLRMALACAVQRSDGTVVYTELDFWDSPYVINNPSSNVQTGGDVVYAGGDVVEYKIDQLPTGVWRHYSVDLTSYVNRAWRLSEGDHLESVYVVIEAANEGAQVTLMVDNLWIKSPLESTLKGNESSAQV